MDEMLFPYMGTTHETAQPTEPSTHQLHQAPTFEPYLGYSLEQDLTNYWGYGQISTSPVDQFTLAPWISQINNLTPTLHEPPNPEPPAKRAITPTQPQSQVKANKSRQDSRKGYNPLDRQAYRAYHRKIGARIRKKDREEREQMEAATKDLEQVNANLVARTRALMEERLALRAALRQHARMCNDERITNYLALTARPT